MITFNYAVTNVQEHIHFGGHEAVSFLIVLNINGASASLIINTIVTFIPEMTATCIMTLTLTTSKLVTPNTLHSYGSGNDINHIWQCQ